MKLGFIQLFVCFLALGFLQAKAQHFGTGWDGGNGEWNATNPNWDGSSTYFNSNNRTDDARPTFYQGGGTVVVDDSKSSMPITFGEMDFYNAGDWNLSGDVLDNVELDYSATVVDVNSGAGNVTIGNRINIAPNPTNGGSLFFNQSAGTTLTLGQLNISSIPISGTDGAGHPYTNQSAPFSYDAGYDGGAMAERIVTIGTQTVIMFATNGSTIVMNGNYTNDANLSGGLLFGNYGDSSMATGTYIIKGGLDQTPNSSKEFDFGSGNIILETSDTGKNPMTFVGNNAGLLQTLLTQGNQTVTNAVGAQSTSNAEVGAGDGSTSTYTGQISAGNGQGTLDLHAGTGGTVTFSGGIGGENEYTSKSGAGTVIITSNNSYSTDTSDAFEMKSGTTLIENDGAGANSIGQNGDAFGNGASGNPNSSHTTNAQVFTRIDSGATLGGTGHTFINVVAQDGSSRIDPGVALHTPGFQTFNSLHLDGGITATSGITMDFKIDSMGDGDYVELGNGSFTLGGTVTLNFTSTDGGVSTDPNGYVLVTGNGIWSDDDSTDFVVNGPAGYAGTANFDDSRDLLTVNFTATPEPSTYAMLGLGMIALLLLSRRLRRLPALSENLLSK